jgi:DNA-binding NarL/FixJ family response regulator
MTLPESFF